MNKTFTDSLQSIKAWSNESALEQYIRLSLENSLSSFLLTTALCEKKKLTEFVISQAKRYHVWKPLREVLLPLFLDQNKFYLMEWIRNEWGSGRKYTFRYKPLSCSSFQIEWNIAELKLFEIIRVYNLCQC